MFPILQKFPRNFNKQTSIHIVKVPPYYQTQCLSNKYLLLRGTRYLPSIGTTDGSLMDGDIALLSTAATSASRAKALTGGVEDSLGRLARLDRPEEEGRVDDVSLLRSAGKPVVAGFRRTAGALDSPP